MAIEKSNATAVTILNQRIDGITNVLKNEKVAIPVLGKVITAANLLHLYRLSLDARTAVIVKRGAYQGAIKTRDEVEADRVAADDSLKAWVFARFGAQSAEASRFGFVPKKAPVVSAETRALSVAKNKATREARNTMGKKQKLKIKGVLPAPIEPAAPVATSSTAPPALAASPVTTTATAPMAVPLTHS